MAAALTSWYDSRMQEIRCLVGKHRELAIEHRDVDPAGRACVLLPTERREQADRRVEAGAEIADGYARTHRVSVCFTGQAHATRDRLHDHVVRRVLAIWAVLAEAADRAPD